MFSLNLARPMHYPLAQPTRLSASRAPGTIARGTPSGVSVTLSPRLSVSLDGSPVSAQARASHGARFTGQLDSTGRLSYYPGRASRPLPKRVYRGRRTVGIVVSDYAGQVTPFAMSARETGRSSGPYRKAQRMSQTYARLSYCSPPVGNGGIRYNRRIANTIGGS